VRSVSSALIRCSPHEQTRNRLIVGAVEAVTHAGDLDRAEALARSISSHDSARALAEIDNGLLAAGERDRAIALARFIATGYPSGASLEPSQEAERSPERYLDDILRGRPRRGSVQHVPELAMRTARALDHIDAGDPDQAVQIAYSSNPPLWASVILYGIATRMVVYVMTDRAAQLADWFDDRQSRAEFLVAVAAAAAAHGDAVSERRLAGRAAMLARTEPRHRPRQLLLLAEALAQVGENAYACRTAERVVILCGTSDVLHGTYNELRGSRGEFLCRAAEVLAQTGAISRAIHVAHTIPPYGHYRDLALEAVATALASAGNFDHARVLTQGMAAEYKARTLAAIALAMGAQTPAAKPRNLPDKHWTSRRL
jgi:hypothetical protein